MFTSGFIFTIPIEQVIRGALAFSPYGKALVAITTTLLRVWRAPSLAETDAGEKRAEGKMH